jgi:hypothetical protein
MNIATTTASTRRIKRRLVVVLIVAVAALAASVTWTLPAVAIDTAHGQTRTTTPISHDVPARHPAATTLAAELVDPDDRPIIVADAYHGVGFMVCRRRGAQPVTVADSYHGVGVAVCV